jgi:two-component system, cell cycle sensor histidine kinase and response regulator CckA
MRKTYMLNQNKTKEQLIRELNMLRSRVAEMETTLSQAKLVEERLHLVDALKEELLRSATLNEKLKIIADGVVRIFAVDFARIWIINPGDRCDSGCVHAKVTESSHVCHYRDRCLHLLVSSGRYSHIDGRMHCRVPLASYKIGRIASGAEPKLVTNDVVNDPRVHDQAWARELGLVSFAGYRILAKADSPIGVLALFSKRLLSSHDDFLLEGIANTTAQVFETTIMDEALNREKRRFQRLAKNAPFGTVMVDRDGSFSYANPKFKEMFGYDLHDVPNGREWLRKAYPDAEYRHEVISAWIEDLKGSAPGETRPRVFSIICKDGSKKIVLFRTVKLDSGEDLMTCEDITERKRSENALGESEAILRTVLQSAPIGIGLVTNRIFGWTNESLSKMTEYSASDFLGQNARMLYENDEEFDRVGTVIYGQIKAGGAGLVETRWKRKDGSLIDIILSSSAIAPGDLSKGVVFSAIDISERKRSEQDLREAEERMRLLIESAPIAIRIATQGRYSYVNPAFLNLFGYDCPEEIEGLPVEALYVEKDKRLISQRNENRAMGLEVDPHYRVTGIRKGGAHIDLEAWGSQISYQGQRSTLRFLIDVTESNALRAQLLQAQKMEAIGTLAGGIAHDFNNLLQTVLGYSDFMLRRKKEGEQDHTDLEKIYKAGKRGADLVRSLLTFSRKVETRYVPVDINQEITQVRHILSRTIPKTIKIDLHLNRDVEAIKADPSQIGQVLMNLGVNARDAMPDGGILSIETANVKLDREYCSSHLEAMPGSYVLLTVSDTGQGMDRKTLSHIFEPFFTTKERGKGTGLGLATVYGIVKQHNGHIICYSEPGHGTTFKIYLPSIQKDKDLGSPPKETAIPHGTETILLVEDDDEIRELGAGLLNEFGYEVITAGNGREALKTYEREAAGISLIILDLIMPVMDGRQCLAEILRINPNARVVIASGYSETGPVDGVIAAGAKGFIQKPYSMRQLLTTVREILDKN